MRAIILLALAGGLVGCGPKEPAKTAAVEECWMVARALLRSPSTATFVNGVGEGPEAFVTLDAANAYGTPVRSTTHCTMEAVGDGWLVKSASVDGAEVDPALLATALYSTTAERLEKTRKP